MTDIRKMIAYRRDGHSLAESCHKFRKHTYLGINPSSVSDIMPKNVRAPSWVGYLCIMPQGSDAADVADELVDTIKQNGIPYVPSDGTFSDKDGYAEYVAGSCKFSFTPYDNVKYEELGEMPRVNDPFDWDAKERFNDWAKENNRLDLEHLISGECIFDEPLFRTLLAERVREWRKDVFYDPDFCIPFTLYNGRKVRFFTNLLVTVDHGVETETEGETHYAAADYKEELERIKAELEAYCENYPVVKIPYINTDKWNRDEMEAEVSIGFNRNLYKIEEFSTSGPNYIDKTFYLSATFHIVFESGSDSDYNDYAERWEEYEWEDRAYHYEDSVLTNSENYMQDFQAMIDHGLSYIRENIDTLFGKARRESVRRMG